MKSARERAEERREAKLEAIRDQVASGSLVIRKMTAEELERYPPRLEKGSSRPRRPRG